MAIKVEALDDYHGQASWRISTASATWVYHRVGGGFAGLFDPDGRDWISYRPGGGAGGEYRGIPNAIFPEGGFHPGNPDCRSELIEADEQRVVIESWKNDDWHCRWTIDDAAATLEMLRIGGPYWWLYEGTPGGEYDESAAWWEDSAGVRRRCDESWEGSLPGPRKVTFGTSGSKYKLELHDQTDRPADVTDSFWSMEKKMTVWGFGRTLASDSGRWMHLREVPAVLRVALLRDG